MTRGKEKLKILLICLSALMIALMLVGCKKVEEIDGNDGTSVFVLLEDTMDWKVVYHRETKVMYAVSDGSYNRGTFTLLVDTDGKPLLYKGAEDEE